MLTDFLCCDAARFLPTAFLDKQYFLRQLWQFTKTYKIALDYVVQTFVISHRYVLPLSCSACLLTDAMQTSVILAGLLSACLRLHVWCLLCVSSAQCSNRYGLDCPWISPSLCGLVSTKTDLQYVFFTNNSPTTLVSARQRLFRNLSGILYNRSWNKGVVGEICKFAAIHVSHCASETV